jgi:hypothetical protein
VGLRKRPPSFLREKGKIKSEKFAPAERIFLGTQRELFRHAESAESAEIIIRFIRSIRVRKYFSDFRDFRETINYHQREKNISVISV